MFRRTAPLPILIALTAALLVSVGPAPAQASTSTVSVPNGVLYNTCRYHQFSYSIDPALEEWDLSVAAFDPRGVESAGAYLLQGSDPAAGTTEGSNGLFICGYEPAGRWRVEAEVSHWTGSSYVTEQLPTSYFSMRNAHSRTNVHANDTTAHVGQTIKLRVKVKGEFPARYAALSYVKVVLKRKTPNGWKRFGKGYTNDRGVVKFKKTWKWHNRVKVKAIAKPDHPYQKSKDSIVIR